MKTFMTWVMWIAATFVGLFIGDFIYAVGRLLITGN